MGLQRAAIMRQLLAAQDSQRFEVRPRLNGKDLLSMHDLRRRALAEIRQQDGCHNVQDIAINRVTDALAETNWSLCVLSAGAADANTAARAALHVQSVLRRDYDLMTDITMIDQLTERDRIELLARAQDAWDRAPQD